MSETEVRKLRNQVYSDPISDAEWEKCKVNWMQPDQIKFLKDCVTRIPKLGNYQKWPVKL